MPFDRIKFNETKYKDFKLSDLDKERIEAVLFLSGSGKKILDVGCCDGTIGKKLIDNGNEVFGVDIAKECVEQAVRSGIKAQVCNLEEGFFNFGFRFDLVLAGEIIEHIEDTNFFLQNIRKVLREQGSVIITTPNLATLGRRFLLLFGKNPHIEVSPEPYSAGHLRYFVKDTLFWLLEKNGFRITAFTSDRINLNESGTLRSEILAKILPTFGKTLIVKAVKT